MKGIEQYFQYDASLTPIYYKGTWNASTNTPTLASSVGTAGDFYLVSVAGSTDLNGITNWAVGDWAVFNGTAWQRVEGGADGNFANLSVTGTSTLGNIQVASNTISSVDANGNIVLAPNGTGDVQIDADTVRVGDANANATITTNGTGDLILNTNSGTNSGMRLDTSGNLGLGVTPSAWGNGYKSLDIGSIASFFSDSNVTANVSANQYIDAGGRKYKTTNYATMYQQYNGQHQFFTAPSGTAGNAITFTQAMTLDASGNLGIGTSGPVANLDVRGVSGGILGQFLENDSGNSRRIRFSISGNVSSIESTASAGTTNLALAVDGSERMRLDASGNLGLGVTPNASWQSTRRVMQIGANIALWGQSSGAGSLFLSNNTYFDGTNFRYLNTSGAGYYAQSTDGSHSWNIAASGTAGNAISFTQAMTLDASGNLVLGTTAAASARLYVRGSGTTSSTASFEAANSSGATRLYVQDDGTTRFFGSAGSETMRLDSSGNLLVGTTSDAQNANVGIKNIPSGAVYVVNSGGTDGFSYYNTTAGAYRFYVQNNGTIAATNTTISAISDQRFKENIRDLDAGLNAIMALKPRKFDWKTGKGKDIKDDRGFIAQEFEQVFPDLVDDWADPAPEGEEPYKSVRQDLIPVLVKAIQELKAEIDSLKAQLGA